MILLSSALSCCWVVVFWVKRLKRVEFCWSWMDWVCCCCWCSECWDMESAEMMGTCQLDRGSVCWDCSCRDLIFKICLEVLEFVTPNGPVPSCSAEIGISSFLGSKIWNEITLFSGLSLGMQDTHYVKSPVFVEKIAWILGICKTQPTLIWRN